MAASQKKDTEIPEKFLCPITRELMVEPVQDNSGHTYERRAIEDWLKKKKTSPITRKELSVDELKPCKELTEEIASFVKLNDLPSLLNRTVVISPSGGDKRISLSARYTDGKSTPFPSQVGDDQDEYLLHLKVETSPDGFERTPVDVCCVVDVSGSMQIEAEVQDDDGKLESNGLSILDVVKHAVRTVINSLKPKDRLSLVSFSNQATLVLPLTYMNKAGIKAAEAALNKMTPDGCTNLWDGLKTGMETLRTKKLENENRFSSCLLLTDGQPNVEPPRGHLPTLRKYRDQHQVLPCTINTFGFGYNIDSTLLTDLAVEGGGNYIFTPDGGFVGTAFVNALSNLLSTFANGLEVLITTEHDDVQLAKAVEGKTMGGYPIRRTSWGGLVHLGSLRFGQSRDVVIPVLIKRGGGATIQKGVSVGVRYTINGKRGESSFEGEAVNDDVAVQAQLCRLHTVDSLRESAIGSKVSLDEGRAILQNCIKTISASSAADREEVKGLLKDLKVQATQALSKQGWFDRWGQHYLPSLSMSHSEQLCSNFKDPGLQFYGGDVFQAFQDEMDSIFLSLPPPKVQTYVSPYAHMGGYVAPAAAAAPVNMGRYYNAGGGCFAGDCVVLMGDGKTLKKVSEIRRGDVVSAGSEGKEAKIVCVVQTLFRVSSPTLVSLEGGLRITEYHPVRINGKWSFPNTLSSPAPSPSTSSVYSFVMESGHVAVINGVECVGLGHNFVGNDVVAHPFFGSQRVVEELKQMKGWQNGLVQLEADAFLKSFESNLIEGLDLRKEVCVY